MKKTKKYALPEEADIIALLQNRPLLSQKLAKLLHLPPSTWKKLASLLSDMDKRGDIIQYPDGAYGIPDSPLIVEGQFLASPAGGGRVRITGYAEDLPPFLHISPFQTYGAWNKDKVRAVVTGAPGGNRGKIIEIVERLQKRVPAILVEKHKRSWIFRPADGKDRHYFLVKPDRSHNPELGTLAILEPLEQLGGKHNERDVWGANILSLLGPADRVKEQEAIVKENHQVPGTFPDLALEQANALPDAPTEGDMASREDWRDVDFVTIDGADARDFDDAIHVTRDGNDYILNVAIADVSHYVQPDPAPGCLDKEARSRGNSWYFPTSVEPMLPRTLSNGLCSLNPNQDRLAMLVQMRFNEHGDLLERKFAPVVMKSKARLTYDQVAEHFAGNRSIIENAKVRHMLDEALDLYAILARRRKKRGTLDFILPEPKYSFDAEGRLTNMKVAERNDSHRLIEEFMIAANEAVASWLADKKLPFLYRIHPSPEPEKLMQLFNGLRAMAPEVLPPEYLKPGTADPAAIQGILATASDTPQEFIVNRLCLRSMGQARYQPQNVGHFGLASSAYCHFTSPIRRYADLMVHRAVKAALNKDTRDLPDEEALAGIANDLNILERRAVESEREMGKRMACLALAGKEGQTMSGTVSAITDFGVFMEFDDLPAEGLIRLEDLADDWFESDSTRQMLTGMRTGQLFRIGDPIKAKIKNIDNDRLEIHLSRTEERKKQPARTRKGVSGAKDSTKDGKRPYFRRKRTK